MTPEKRDPKVHHQTARGARIALAQRLISRASYEAILAGTLSLDRAKELGREGGPGARTSRGGSRTTTERPPESRERQQAGTGIPPQPASRISKNTRIRECMCGCGRATTGLFAQGHDMRMFQVAREHLTEGRELTEEQREYLEDSGKMERVRARIAEGEGKRRGKEQRKTKRVAKRRGAK